MSQEWVEGDVKMGFLSYLGTIEIISDNLWGYHQLVQPEYIHYRSKFCSLIPVRSTRDGANIFFVYLPLDCKKYFD